MISVPDLTVILGAATLMAVLVLWLTGYRSTGPDRTDAQRPEPLALLFDDGILHHGTCNALAHFALLPGTHGWADLRETILSRFPDFPETAGAGHEGSMTLLGSDASDPSQIDLRWRDNICWVTLLSGAAADGPTGSGTDPAEIAALRRSSDTCPNPVWQEDPQGTLIWNNGAYAVLADLAQGRDAETPLFSRDEKCRANRVTLQTAPGEKPDWYELATVRLDGVTVHHATCINAVVEAEVAQRNFVQTLAKTFAHLSIGLAIFDRNGQLALFNPALVDLTGLPAHFLSVRPTMLSFFDQLRENRQMPEPKNYRTWRQEISEVISAATDGRYQETWSLESGQTYRVKGRPHPDGATAFLIEDISAEVALTRNFRAELELGQSLLDTMDDGLAVFAASGLLTFCNAAYRDMWDQTPESSFADVTINDCVKVWKGRTAPNPLWHDIGDFVTEMGNRQGWEMPLSLNNGPTLTCRLTPLGAGATLVRFSRLEKVANRTTEASQPEHWRRDWPT